MITNNITAKTSVIIIGAGPTGLSLAVQLLRYGIDFIILEKNQQTTHLSKAIVVQARTLEIFHETGLAEKAINAGRITTAMNIFYKGKKKATLDLEGMGEGLSLFPFALSLEQSKTEQLLVNYLSENNKHVHWGTEFLRYEENDGITVYYKDANGAEQKMDAQYLVGCDGAGSLVRHQLGTTFEGDTMAKIFYVTDVELSSPVVNKDQLFIFLIKKGFVLFFPMEGRDHYRVIGILPDKTAEDKFTFEEIQGSITEQIMIPLSFEKVKWFSTYKVHSRKATLFMKGRCFIAGDAAHIHTPAGGQGMNTGIQDAYNLAWKLAYTIRYKTGRELLETYNTERMENARHLLKTTDRMFDFMTGSGSFWNFIRLNIFPIFARLVSRNTSLNKLFFPLLSQIGIAYPQSALTIPGKLGKINAGDRMPYFIFSDGTNIFDHLKAASFKLLFFGIHNNNAGEYFKGPAFQIPIFSFTEIPRQIFGDVADFYVLLRPDNHISYIGKDIKCCSMLLEQISAD